jgi:serine protease Do
VILKPLASWLLLLLMLACSVPAHADLIATVKQVKQSIVAVGTFSKLRSPAFVLLGTGFAIGDGTLVATNSHVVPEIVGTEESGTLAVLTPGKSPPIRQPRLLLRDPDHDLAILKLDGPPLPPMPLGLSHAVQEGQGIAFTGFPIGSVLGLTPVTHRGIVSSITPIVIPTGRAGELSNTSARRLRNGAFPVFQLDATAYPGNSGGPMYDIETGTVLGIINMVFVKESKESVLEKPSGISFAIPSEHLSRLLEAVKAP